VCSAPTFSDLYLRYSNLAQVGQNGGAGISAPGAEMRYRRTPTFGAGANQGSMVFGNLIANPICALPTNFGQLVVTEDKGVVVRLGELADVDWVSQTDSMDVRLQRIDGDVPMVYGSPPPPHSLRVIKNVAAIPDIQPQIAPGGLRPAFPMTLTSSYRVLHHEGMPINEVLLTTQLNVAHRYRRDLPLPGLVPLPCSCPSLRSRSLLDWRGFLF